MIEDYIVNIGNTVAGYQGFGVSSINATAIGNEGSFVFKTYPNPATNFIQVNLQSRDGNASYKIVNTLGQLVKKGDLVDTNISVYDLKSGVYLLEVTDGQKTFKSKIIKK